MKRYTVFKNIESWRGKQSVGEFTQEEIVKLVQAKQLGKDGFLVEHGFFNTITETYKVAWLAEHWPIEPAPSTPLAAAASSKPNPQGQIDVLLRTIISNQERQLACLSGIKLGVVLLCLGIIIIPALLRSCASP